MRVKNIKTLDLQGITNHIWSRWWELDLGKEFLEYYIVYDKNDEILAFCNDLDELSKFVDVKKKFLKFRFKTNDFIYVKIPNIVKIYKFI